MFSFDDEIENFMGNPDDCELLADDSTDVPTYDKLCLIAKLQELTLSEERQYGTGYDKYYVAICHARQLVTVCSREMFQEFVDIFTDQDNFSRPYTDYCDQLDGYVNRAFRNIHGNSEPSTGTNSEIRAYQKAKKIS